jgi:hypothetical protein
MSIRSRLVVAVIALSITPTAVPTFAQHAPQTDSDSRTPIVLTPSEAETMLTGMRTYFETIRASLALAENDTMRSAEIAAKSGAGMLEGVPFTTGLIFPLEFTTMSLDTHDKFDKLTDKIRRGTSRTEALSDLPANQTYRSIIASRSFDLS